MQLCLTGCAQLHLLGCVVLRQGPHLLMMLRLLPPLILLQHVLLLMHRYQRLLPQLCRLSCCVACSIVYGKVAHIAVVVQVSIGQWHVVHVQLARFKVITAAKGSGCKCAGVLG
jgi:hypothetical protein